VAKTKAFRRIGPKTLPGEMLGIGDLKTLINKQFKIQNITPYRGESAMGKVSSEKLKWLPH
jgi:hypothetical protein